MIEIFKLYYFSYLCIVKLKKKQFKKKLLSYERLYLYFA